METLTPNRERSAARRFGMHGHSFATHQAPSHVRAVRLRGNFGVWFGASLLSLSTLAADPPDWEKTVTSTARGDFPNPRPLKATYNFGWSELIAATAEINFSKSDGGLQLQGSGQTIGVVRALWKFDVRHRALADASTLRPILMNEVDEVRGKTIATDLLFNANGVVRTRNDSKSKKPPKSKTFTFPAVFDMHSALLFVRSQPLHEGDVYRLVVYPATGAYLATLTVAGHSSVTVPAGSYKAIKFEVQLSKIGKKRELEPHKKFSRASVWISDDADRLLLRIEARVFIGIIFAELQSVDFPEEKR